VTTVVFSNEVCSTFTAMSSGTLLSDHVYTNSCSSELRVTVCRLSSPTRTVNLRGVIAH